MADLLTPRELALWTSSTVGKTEAEVAADPFAVEVIDKVSQMVQFVGGHQEWSLDPGPTSAPFDVRMVVLQVCKRSYENPKQVVQEGSVGPIGGDRVLDVAALFLELTDSERAVLTKYNPEGDPAETPPELWVLTTTRGDDVIADTSRLYVGDDQQINLTQSEDPREWMIPMFSPGDPGGDI